ncbi:putative bifunctional fatty acid transporter/acyl-CoA synthetase [Rhexocercosporidium sp. MPI-PUGE-AT-0058]|nr:putative bifunctional fatty acid transporter/acyl-CoA synthetase [Rhexocercosporidium sp. MPI-PUGE-AT-0058]
MAFSMILIYAVMLVSLGLANRRLGFTADVWKLRKLLKWKNQLEVLHRDLDQKQVPRSLYGLLARIRNKKREMLWFEGQSWTYERVERDVDSLAEYLTSNGVADGDVVAVFMTNSPEMVVAMLAISKIGAISALVNSKLRVIPGETFSQCLHTASPSCILSTPDLAPFVLSSLPHHCLNLASFKDIHADNATSFDSSVKSVTLTVTDKTPSHFPTLDSSTAFLIYTSGTTGLPKACIIKNRANVFCAVSASPSPNLRTYCALPLFHGTALFNGLCVTLGNEGTLCLARKFSARNFFADIYHSRATALLYVGEVCRYLVATPPTEFDKKHQCRLAMGNGLREDIYDKFRSRFNIQKTREFYRATEGAVGLEHIGTSSKDAGLVAKRGVLMRWLDNSFVIIRIDPETEEPLRDANGFCIEASPNEVGEAIGRLSSREALTEYLGQRETSEKRLIKDVFTSGDLFSRMGDLLVRDSSGGIKFCQRRGENWRWKGENVSAGEVRTALCNIDGIRDSIAWGVLLKMYDGQAGAAAVTLEDDVSADGVIRVMYDALTSTGLPYYALPRLVRITDSIPVGPTLKHQKKSLVEKPWNPQHPSNEPGISNQLYWLNGTRYERLDEKSWSRIEQGVVKL